MSLAQQIQVINEGLLSPGFPPDQLEQVLSNGTQRVVNWRRIRPAVEALGNMPWYDLESQWKFFLDTDRYPLAQGMDLRPDEVEIFRQLVRNLINGTSEGMRILSSVQPEVSLTDVTVTIQANDLRTLGEGIEHIRRTTDLAAIDDVITISSLQPGSLDIILTAGKVSLFALQLAIVLAKSWKNPQTAEKVRGLVRLWNRMKSDDQVDEDTVRQTVLDGTEEEFWKSAEGPLTSVVNSVGKNPPEAKNKITASAREIYEKADEVSADWKLPPAVISGLPGGLTVSLNYEDPEKIGQVIRALVPPRSRKPTT